MMDEIEKKQATFAIGQMASENDWGGGVHWRTGMRLWALGLILVMSNAAMADVATRPGTEAKTAPIAGRVMTRAELEKVPLESVMDPAPAEGALVFPDVRTAVWLEKKEFRVGEPVAAWLMMHSLTKQIERGLPADFDLGVSGAKSMAGGSARMQLVRKKGESEQVVADVKGEASRAKRLLMPAGGYLVNSGDARNLSVGKLDAGEYTLRFWAEGQRAEARFVVTGVAPAPVATAAVEEAKESSVMQWCGSWNDPVRRRLRRGAGGGGAAAPPPDGKLKLENGYLSVRRREDFEKGLAMGVGTGADAKYFVRLSDVPRDDGVVKMSARYVPGKGADHMEIVLSRSDAGGVAAVPTSGPTSGPATMPALALPAWPQVYFLVENLGPPSHFEQDSERNAGKAGGRMEVTKPLEMDVTMPEVWAARLNYTKKVRVTVMVASDPVPVGIEQRGENIAAPGAAVDPSAGKRWIGVVRSEPMEVDVKEEEE